MGYTYNDLVAPAILLDNPGITREEFAKLLDQTHSSCFHEYNPEDKWDYYTKETEDDNYHNGLEGLVHILLLENSQKFVEFQKPRVDENGFFIKAPYMLPAREGADYQFEVIIHEKNVFEEPKIQEDYSFEKLNVGDIWEETMMGADMGIVLKIVEEKDLSKEDDYEESSPGYFYNMIIKPFNAQYREEHFKSKQELYQKWPQFHTDFANDWSQKTGHFLVGCLGGNNFLWLQKQGKYYLDKQTFDRIPASFGSSLDLGYVDLILTSEAIKHKAWKVLSRRGLQHCSQFLKDFPDALPRYARAVWDSHTSLSAKMQGMSISDFLRFRNIPFR